MENLLKLLTKKHARIALNKLERKLQTVDPSVRKIVLDALNEFARDIMTALYPAK